ncbi:hypothetical protein [Agrobacterium rosae]|uniref:Acyl-CoA dehydrogenase/oxidase C-terminal domain-containing protein n=1 Tax=Agrobacterium rosae TaxID=1972867 RepID=A0AAW9FI51_9HYPH|nr:hypothetical protein [Agrobacterium rosae]MDX8305540.1 hypothetical protein [Agrobacterium rosae]
MLHVPASTSARHLFTLARSSDACNILRAMCRYVTSKDGYLVAKGFVLHGRLDDHRLVDPSVYAGDVAILNEQQDIALAHLGLSLSRVAHAAPAEALALRQQIAVTAVRLGLLAQALDTAYRHLEGRRSFGQKVLHHQLVKARFAFANELVVRLLEELSLLDGDEAFPCADNTQTLISEQFVEVSKLMGGHGYLLDGINTLEYLSSMIGTVYATQSVLPVTLASTRNVTLLQAPIALGGVS